MAQGRISTDDIVVRDDGPTAGEPGDDRIDLDAPPPPGPAQPQAAEDVPLLDDHEADGFLTRWSEVQARFVDDPQGAVRDGDSLVAELVQALVQRFSQHKAGLEQQWQAGAEPETEELRRALQQYRSFFQRLLAT
ncbi:MAG: hypothetical protein JWQ53_2157 [Klenkia sp.]|nr:hypothetical protein [Klenkia sp.]